MFPISIIAVTNLGNCRLCVYFRSQHRY